MTRSQCLKQLIGCYIEPVVRSPMDVISHLPVICEDAAVPFVFVDSKVREEGSISFEEPLRLCTSHFICSRILVRMRVCAVL